jgi:hypothetical protein
MPNQIVLKVTRVVGQFVDFHTRKKENFSSSPHVSFSLLEFSVLSFNKKIGFYK